MSKLIEAKKILLDDLDRVYQTTFDATGNLNSVNILLTGGTGYIGKWLLSYIKFANEKTISSDQIRVVVLTRDVKAFEESFPELAYDKNFTFIKDNILLLSSKSMLLKYQFTHLVHAATDASADLNEREPLIMFNTIVHGTQNILDFARIAKIKKILYLSTGGVYGTQPFEVEKVAECWSGSPNCTDPKNAYVEGKRSSEMLCAIYGKQYGLDISIARIFAQIGPMMNFDIHFAIGNFIRDALLGRKIVVKGSGLAERSYLYASDLVAWLFKILTKGLPGVAYNVGSEEAISIAKLAILINELLDGKGYDILGLQDNGWNPGRYIPDTNKIRAELHVTQKVCLNEAIIRSANWYKQGM